MLSSLGLTFLENTPKTFINVFEPHLAIALQRWNQELVTINKQTPVSSIQLAENRLAALQTFQVKYDELALFDLAETFRSQWGHWVNGEPPYQAIQKIIVHLNHSLLKSMPDLEPCYSYIKGEEAKTFSTKKQKRCLLHPERRAIGKNGLCFECLVRFELSELEGSLGKRNTVFSG